MQGQMRALRTGPRSSRKKVAETPMRTLRYHVRPGAGLHNVYICFLFQPHGILPWISFPTCTEAAQLGTWGGACDKGAWRGFDCRLGVLNESLIEVRGGSFQGATQKEGKLPS